MSYHLTMSRWDEPTSFDRWIARHRTGFRVCVGLYMVLGICWMVYRQSYSLIGAIGIGLIALVLSWKVPRTIEKYDSAQHQGPNAT